MRVRVLKQCKGYWNYGVQTWQPGEELSGELARHLAENTEDGSVEVIEADPEPETPAPVAPEDSGDQGDPAADGEPPVNGTADDLMAWVDGDPGRAAAALAAEQAKDRPRTTVVKRLQALVEE